MTVHDRTAIKKMGIILVLIAVFYNAGAQHSGEKNIFQSSEIEPKQIEKLSEGHYLIDFGKAAFGTLLIESQQPQSKKLILHLGEKLSADGSIDRDPGGTIRYQKVVLSEVPARQKIMLQLPPDKRNTNQQAIALPDSFGVIMPFRYCEIENLKVPFKDISVYQKAFWYRFNEEASSFICSDTTLNQVWDLCKYTIKATSFTGIYIDGDRERIPYEADAYINQLSHYCVDHEYGMAKETIRYFMNNPTWPTEWLLHTIMMAYQDYYYTGDTTLISAYYEQLREKTLYQLAKRDGLISSFSRKVTDEYMQELGFSDPRQRIKDLVDWPPAQKDTGWKLSTKEGERDGHEMLPVNTVVNCFFYENMRIMAELAKVLNKQEDHVFFSKKAEKAKQAINDKLLDKEKGIYIDGIGSTHSSIHSNMLPLAFGLVPVKYQNSVIDFVKAREMACSVYGAQYLLEGLYKAGEADYAFELMTSTSDRSWWNMIRVGSTMTMEAWDLKYKPNADWNHAWGAAPGNIVTRYLWGITPAQPGFEKVVVNPQLSDLTSSKIKVPTIKGPIHAEYKQVEKNSDLFIIELPTDMEGEFVITSIIQERRVELNGKVIQANNGVLPLKSGENQILIFR